MPGTMSSVEEVVGVQDHSMHAGHGESAGINNFPEPGGSIHHKMDHSSHSMSMMSMAVSTIQIFPANKCTDIFFPIFHFP